MNEEKVTPALPEKTKHRFQEIVLTVLFCAFLGVLMVMVFVLPKRAYSPNEKRYLASAPEFTTEDLFSGKYGENVETFLSDQFAGRDFFVGLNAYLDLFSGRNGSNGVYKGSDDYLLAAPVVLDEENLSKNLAKLNAFCKKVSLPAHIMVVPSSGYIMQNKLPAVHDAYEDDAILARIRESLIPEIGWIDLEKPFLEQKDDYQLYYKTDHHWTSRGAYEGYLAYCGAMNLTPVPESAFSVETYSGFCGTAYSKSALWLSATDDIELWKNNALSDIHVTILDGEPVESNSLFFPAHLEEPDKYPVFLDGNHSVVKITNPGAEGGKLLLIKDSFGHCFAPLLAAHYKEIFMVDLRYYKLPLSETAAEEGFDEILVLYSMDNLVNDTNFAWLK